MGFPAHLSSIDDRGSSAKVHTIDLGAERIAREKQQEIGENAGIITIVGLSAGIVGTGICAAFQSKNDKAE